MKLSIALGSCLLASSFAPAFADVVSGTATVTYTKVYALGLAASPLYPEYDNDCKALVGSLLNSQATVDYTINTQNGKQAVYYNYLGQRIQLSAMGLFGSYSFIGTAAVFPELAKLDARSVFFSMNKEFKNPNSSFNFIFPTEGRPEYAHEFQCVVSTTSMSIRS